MKYIKIFEQFDDNIIPSQLIDVIKDSLKININKLLGCGKFGCAFKIDNNKVLKISTDLKEYEYAKKLKGIRNKHIADIYDVYYIEYNNEKYVIIIKEYCLLESNNINKKIESFEKYSFGDMTLTYLSSEFLHGDISLHKFKSYFDEYEKNEGTYDLSEWYYMIMELRKHKIYVKDLDENNIGYKVYNGKKSLCIIDLGLGYWNNINFKKEDEL